LHNPGADWAGIPFGRVFHAQCAAYLGQGELVEEIVNSMADRVYPSLHMSLGPDGRIFNFDGNGAFPDIINRSIAFSLNGTLDLLRSIPPGWEEGSIRGILARGQIRIDELTWDRPAGTVRLKLTSGKDQTVTLRMPTFEAIESDNPVNRDVCIQESPLGENSREVTLSAGKKATIELGF